MFQEQSVYIQGKIKPDYTLPSERGEKILNPAQRKYVVR